MGYRELVLKAIDTAFVQLKDLVAVATLYRDVPKTFDFGTGNFPITQPVQTAVKYIEITRNKRSSEQNVTEKELLMKTSEAADLNLYDKLLIGNDTWKFKSVILSDTFLHNVTVVRVAP